MAINTVRRVQQPQREMNANVRAHVRVWPLSGQAVMGLLFLVTLLAFEIFNFDTTRFALTDFLGNASFARLRWATVLAVAFCAIDFAGLLRFFLPQDEKGQMPTELWYLMGAWLLGATMNALMTWWAVNLALLNHNFGNEVLSRGQLLEVVPIFVATLVWITRILFIGSFTVAGGYLFDFVRERPNLAARPMTVIENGKLAATPLTLRRNAGRVRRRWPGEQPVGYPSLQSLVLPESDDLPPFLEGVYEDVDGDDGDADEQFAGAWNAARRSRSELFQER